MKKLLCILILLISFSHTSDAQNATNETINKIKFNAFDSFTYPDDPRIGFGFAYAPSTKYMNFEIIYGKEVNNYKVGMSFKPGSPRGKAVSNQLSNYGRTTDGSGSYFFTFDLGYGKIVKERILLDGELSFGGTFYYTNYLDGRFNGGGYHIITDSKTGIGIGLNTGYIVSKNISVFSGYNTLRGLQFGIRCFFYNN